MVSQETNLAVRMDSDEYFKFTKRMHYGQVSNIIRKFVRSVNAMVDNGQIDEFNAWLYSGKALTIEPLDE